MCHLGPSGIIVSHITYLTNLWQYPGLTDQGNDKKYQTSHFLDCYYHHGLSCYSPFKGKCEFYAYISKVICARVHKLTF